MEETDSGKAEHFVTNAKDDISNQWAWALFCTVTAVFESNGLVRICDMVGISGKGFGILENCTFSVAHDIV